MKRKKFRAGAILIPLVVATCNLLIIVFPRDVIQAAREGASLWFNNVLPALLPFAVGVNLMSSLGVTRFLGRALEKPMRKLFKVPGRGGFVLTAGLLSGYPMGAKMVASLYENGEITKKDANKLACFTNNAGPLFILGAVASGMFNSPVLGYYLIFAHILSALATGVAFRFLPSGGEAVPIKTPGRNERNLGAALSKSVTDGMETLIRVGGFIIVFCVIIRILEVTNVFSLIEYAAMPFFGSNAELVPGVFAGLIEITSGLNKLSENGLSKITLVALSALISFGGFSVHAQSVSYFARAGINSGLYLLSKIVQSGLSALFALIMLPFFYESII